MRNQLKLVSTGLFGGALLLAVVAYGQSSGGSQPGVLGPCPAPTGTASPSATPSAGPSGAPAMCITVAIPQNAAGMGTAAFGTNPLVIPPGTTVTWVNNDSVPHTSTSDTGVWDSGTLNPGQSYSHTFNDSGSFPYHCAIHGAASMSGTIQVQSASPSPTASPTESPTVTPTEIPAVQPTEQPTALPATTPVQGQQ